MKVIVQNAAEPFLRIFQLGANHGSFKKVLSETLQKIWLITPFFIQNLFHFKAVESKLVHSSSLVFVDEDQFPYKFGGQMPKIRKSGEGGGGG